MALDAEQMERIIVEVDLGVPAPRNEPEELRVFRKRIRVEVAHAKRQGYMVILPLLVPDISEG